MHLITHGLVKVDSKREAGQLLFTERSLFVLRTKTSATTMGAHVGGAIGALIGQMMDKRKARKSPPEYLQDPEIVELDEAVRERLLTTQLAVKLPLDQTLQVRSTWLGFEFLAAGQPSVTYSGYFHKNKIAQFLAERGIQAGGG